MDIFDNQEKVINNLNQSAKNLGIEDIVKKTRREVRAFAKKNCKRCYGLGGFNHVAPDGKQGTLECSCVRLYEVQMIEDESSLLKANEGTVGVGSSEQLRSQ